MRTIKKVEIVPEYVEFIPEQNQLKENTIYISMKYETSSHLCLCGCKNLVVLPFGKWNSWKLNTKNSKISFSPSIGNYNFECKSHYIITNNVANFV